VVERRWAIDSSVVLGALKNGKSDCADLLQLIEDDSSIVVISSTLLVAECARVNDDNQPKLDQLLDSERIEWVQLTYAVAASARALTAKFDGLRGADAVFIASAVAVKCEALFADDKGFPYGETLDGVKICRPHEYPGQQKGNFSRPIDE
jgi:predicted nucleic acid-binding protein